MTENLKQKITEAMKVAMRARDKERLKTLRLILAGIKQVEVDERIVPDDTRITALMTRMVKQRRDASAQFTSAGREDLAQIEQGEIAIIQEFLPQALTEAEIDQLVQDAINDLPGATMKDMGRIMSQLKPKLTGRADMGLVSQRVKKALG